MGVSGNAVTSVKDCWNYKFAWRLGLCAVMISFLMSVIVASFLVQLLQLLTADYQMLSDK